MYGSKSLIFIVNNGQQFRSNNVGREQKCHSILKLKIVEAISLKLSFSTILNVLT